MLELSVKLIGCLISTALQHTHVDTCKSVGTIKEGRQRSKLEVCWRWVVVAVVFFP